MDFLSLSKTIANLPYGKRLPNAVYLHLEGLLDLNNDLSRFIEKILRRFNASEKYNLVKFHLNEFKLSFLSYPHFFDDPHPAISESPAVHLATGKVKRYNYIRSHNPPILHRKEAFLPLYHPFRETFRALTEAEETAGLSPCARIVVT